MKKTIITVLFVMTAIFLLQGCRASEELSYHLSESYTDEPVGTYVAELPSASGMGRLIVLHIFENGNAIRTSMYIGEPGGDYVEEGKWLVEKGELKIILANTSEPPKDIYLSFKYDIEGLRSTSYDETPMGKAEVRFTRVAASF